MFLSISCFFFSRQFYQTKVMLNGNTEWVSLGSALLDSQLWAFSDLQHIS